MIYYMAMTIVWNVSLFKVQSFIMGAQVLILLFNEATRAGIRNVSCIWFGTFFLKILRTPYD